MGRFVPSTSRKHARVAAHARAASALVAVRLEEEVRRRGSRLDRVVDVSSSKPLKTAAIVR
jgi:hypothetical protein